MTNPNSARGRVATARKLADITGTPLRTHRMRRVNAELAIAVLLRQSELRRRGASWHQDQNNAVVIHMGGAR